METIQLDLHIDLVPVALQRCLYLPQITHHIAIPTSHLSNNRFLLYPLPVSATCPRETLEAAWLGQMGYTHKRQMPKWTNETTDVPIGSQG